MNAFAIFTQAQQTLDKNPSDSMAQFIVDLWNASKNLQNKNVELEAQVGTLQLELKEVQDRANSVARQNDWLQSKVAAQSKPATAFSVDNFLASLKQ